MARKRKAPTDYWTVSRLYSTRTGAQGYIHNVAKKDYLGNRYEQWIAVVPWLNGVVKATFVTCDSKDEARNYVIVWRCTNGFDELGVKQ